MNNKPILKRIFTVPTELKYSDKWIDNLVSKIQRHVNADPTAVVHIYGDMIRHPNSIWIHTSTKLYPISKIKRCLREFEGKMLNYGEDDDIISTVRTICVRTRNPEFAAQLDIINTEVRNEAEDLNKHMSETMVDMMFNHRSVVEQLTKRDSTQMSQRRNAILEMAYGMALKYATGQVGTIDVRDEEITHEIDEVPTFTDDYKWISDISNKKHYDKAVNIYNDYRKFLSLSKEDQSKSERNANNYRSSLRYFKKIYDTSYTPRTRGKPK